MVGTATAAHVLTGKTFTSSAGVGLTGTMDNKGAWTNTPTGSGKVTIPAGYHNGSGYVDTSAVYSNGYNAGVKSGGDITVLPCSAAGVNAEYYTATTTYTITEDGKYLFYLLGCAYTSCSVKLSVNGKTQTVNYISSCKPKYDMSYFAVSDVMECKADDVITASATGSDDNSAWKNYIIMSPIKAE